ncbi:MULTISPECIES: diacylglycerol kinase family protein [unclassified Prochlorococcus]|uniref:diacylglycerol kinase family protein n=1 Tax=unclassified Prochlorococcus TaxID=2627481 RepID=UPI000533770D|nr:MULTISPECIES: diacylglycerol kinase family protein [unclassified Prochlorococcus]KGG16754.1 Diacylglycerol kinase [Prochlorococcus sp. MIT 0602]KGG18272.1 Diacylglycerol kinase [Prochlorococcus sp. MIT 0603]
MSIPNFKQNKIDSVTESSNHINSFPRRRSWIISKNLFSSFQYAVQGIRYAFRSQRNFRIHIFIGISVAVFGIFLNLSFTSLSIIALTISTVLILELINTSIEAVVDLSIGRRFHPLARVAKDCAAASVLISATSSVIIALLLILPSLLKKLGG